MKYLLLLYLLTIVSLTATRVSLLKGNKLRWLAIVLPSIIAVCFYSFSLKQNNQLLDWLVSQPNLISGIAMALTFEAIIILVLTVVQIKSFYSIKYPNLWKWISVIPTFQFVISLVFLQTYVFLKIDGYSFSLLAIAFFVATVLSIALLSYVLQLIISKWETRTETQALMSLFQLLLAMFLPLIAKGKKVQFTQITIDYFSILFLTVVVLIITVIGYMMYQRKKQ
ncbi:MAG: hypothetical protein HRT66_08135 [Flavobacteriaceae bacterium]|nr:hypothetical protein [Flavobacteriaceae bacterium]